MNSVKQNFYADQTKNIKKN